MILLVVHHSDSIVCQDESTKIYSKHVDEDSKVYLYRVFVNYIMNPLVIITAYRTSKIEKYGC